MGKRFCVALVLAGLLATVCAAPALAEGYNRGDFIAPSGPGQGWGGLSPDARLNYAAQHSYSPGPHGGYTTTTNKCQDCHSTHYAYGSYRLLRADTREAACDFCHGGGGGSTTNIMMDNAYTTSGAEMALTGGPAADATATMGYGTGHTLGYAGNAPTDIRPAFSSAEGFSCFDCHTPHGNSARALTTFISPGTHVAPSDLLYTVHVRFDLNTSYDPIETYVQEHAVPRHMEFIDLIPEDLVDTGTYPFNDGWLMAWGIEDAGNIVMKYDFSAMGLATGETLARKPVFPTGKYLLIKNPDDENGLGLAGDLATGTVDIGGRAVHTATDTVSVSNKIAIDWEDPLGPAMTYAGDMPIYYTGNDERFPYPWFITGLDEARPGVATVGEFCTDCHDGTAGLSTQAAEVWHPDASDTSTGTYEVAYAHDSQPRGCDRQLYLNPGDESNFGPECRSCHSGASSCSQCHADPSVYDVAHPQESVWDTAGYAPLTEGRSTFQAPAALKTTQDGIATNVGPACMDGGFSFPHRTLGYNMLKDSLWGVDLDGSPIGPGDPRGVGLTATDLENRFGTVAYSFDAGSLVDTVADNLDSACIDCHDATLWNGDDASYSASFTAHNAMYDFPYRTNGAAQDWTVVGWDLLLKGLP